MAQLAPQRESDNTKNQTKKKENQDVCTRSLVSAHSAHSCARVPEKLPRSAFSGRFDRPPLRRGRSIDTDAVHQKKPKNPDKTTKEKTL